jgi:Holliday junction resolvase
MPNKAYQSGRRFEYRIKNYLVDKGYFVIRSAGSHGIADLVAINHSGKVFLLQCKAGGGHINKQEVIKLTRIAQEYICIPILAKIDKEHKIRMINLNTTLEIEL